MARSHALSLPPPQTVASQGLLLASLLHCLDAASALGAVSLHTLLDGWNQRTVPLGCTALGAASHLHA